MENITLYNTSQMNAAVPLVAKNIISQFLETKGIFPVTIFKGAKRTTRLYSQAAYDACVEIGNQMKAEAEGRAPKRGESSAETLAAMLASLDKRVAFMQKCLEAVMAELNIKNPTDN